MMTTTENPIQIHARVEGRVQGVGFRYFVWENANRLGLKGWVRNRWDGSVELVAEGAKSDVDTFVQALWRGPRMSFVTQVKTETREATGEFGNFATRRSG